jgi:DNA-binding transcriptional ArsR family regulator
VRAALLALLAERPMYGYEMISELADRTGGNWRPSPGSVYPTLQGLEDEGLVTVRAEGGKRLFTITDSGRGESGPADAPAPWEGLDVPAVPVDAPDDAPLRESTGRLIGALDQVLVAGTPEQKAQAVVVLDEARRAVYRLLAEGR